MKGICLVVVVPEELVFFLDKLVGHYKYKSNFYI